MIIMYTVIVICLLIKGMCFWPEDRRLGGQWCVSDREWWTVGLDENRGGVQITEQRSPALQHQQPEKVGILKTRS